MYRSIIITENQPVGSKMDTNVQQAERGFDHAAEKKRTEKNLKWRLNVLF